MKKLFTAIIATAALGLLSSGVSAHPCLHAHLQPYASVPLKSSTTYSHIPKLEPGIHPAFEAFEPTWFLTSTNTPIPPGVIQLLPGAFVFVPHIALLVRPLCKGVLSQFILLRPFSDSLRRF